MAGIGGLQGVCVETLATITSATTATQVSATTLLCAAVYIEVDAANTAAVQVGDVNVSASRYMTSLSAVTSGSSAGTLQKGMWIYAPDSVRAGASSLNIASIYVQSASAGQKVHVTYFERMGG